MKFSIIMASYNQVKFIEQAINSVLEQSFQNFELIIFDGGSTDGSVQILEKYKKHSKIKIIIEKDKGLYHARNKGILSAKGDVIGFLNTDDYYELNALEDISNCMQTNPAVDIVYGLNRVVDIKGNYIRVDGDFEFDKKRLIYKYIALPDQATFIRKDQIEYVGLYDSTFSIVADWDFWQRAIKLDLKFYHLNTIVSNYRHYNETLTRNIEFENIRFVEVLRLYRKYNDACISKFIIIVYYRHFVKRPLKKIGFIKSIYYKYFFSNSDYSN